MRTCHFVSWAPHRSGLFEMARDLILAERAAGIDSVFINMNAENPDKRLIKISGRLDEITLDPQPWEAAKDIKIWIVHRGIPAKLAEEAKKHYTILALHGGPEHMAMYDVEQSGNQQTFNSHINMINNYSKAVALNEHDFRLWKLYTDEDHITLINDSIDVDRFSSDGYKWEFHGLPAILYADVTRNIKLPFTLCWAMPGIHKVLPEARLELYGLPFAEINTFRNTLCRAYDIHLLGTLETVQLITSDLRPMMRGAHIGVNPNLSGVRSRVTMEMMACGLPVVASNGDYPIQKYRTYDTEGLEKAICAAWEEIEKDMVGVREKTRVYAMNHFNIKKAVETGWIPLYEKVS